MHKLIHAVFKLYTFFILYYKSNHIFPFLFLFYDCGPAFRIDDGGANTNDAIFMQFYVSVLLFFFNVSFSFFDLCSYVHWYY